MQQSALASAKPGFLDGALLALVWVVTLDAFLGVDAPARWGSLLFLMAALYKREWRLLPAGLLFFFMFVGSLFFPAWVWSVPAAGFLFPLFLTMLCSLPFTATRAQFSWLRRGELDQITWLLVVLVSLISAVALVLWAVWTDYLGVGSAMLRSVRGAPPWLLLFIGIPIFAFLNALAEELIYRGVMQDALEQRFWRRPALVLATQASAFAAVHLSGGFPNGKIGYLMTFFYALALGHLRQRSRGMLAPYLAHVLADIVIGVTLFLLST